ncbi:MAG TPA: alpha/beta hydrolase [Usitatibacter sp.]|nr:alpha/beta hydrolase [Usitatibacter sp.]
MSGTFLYGGTVRANGILQHYLRYGAGDVGRGTGNPALVLVPGIITPAAVWDFVARRFGRAYDTYLLDVRGRGLSERGPQLGYTLDDYAADVIEFARAVGIGRYILLGHSMGARIAIRAARRAPEGLERVVLVDPPVSGPHRRAYPSKLEGVLKLLHAAYRGEAYEALTAPGVARWPEALTRVRAEWLHTCDERAVVETHRGFHEEDIHDDLPHIRIPAALIAAGKGDVIRAEDEAEIRALMPSIEVRRVEDAGHQVPVDDFEGFFAAVSSVLGRAL